MAIDKIAEKNVEQNDKSRSQCVQEEEQLRPARVALGKKAAQPAYQIKEEECRQTKGGVEVGCAKMLQDVDYDLVCRLSLVEATDAHHVDDLSDGDADGRARHKCGDGRQRDYVNDPAEAGKSHEENNRASDDGQGRRYNVSGHVWQSLFSLEKNGPSDGR